jgi:antitoxin component YwqK of YwqJK toxin-antitoxin module
MIKHCLHIIFFVALLSSISLRGLAQCATYKLSDRGDTLNCTDKQGLKQGRWLERYPDLRGNPGYDEEGIYKDDKKEGIWRKYSLQGDILSVESYRWGLLNGKSYYYSLLGLEREEGWWAIDPGKGFDTIDVPDLYVDGLVKQVVIKNEGRSMRHGTWTVYDPMTGRILSTQEYIRDSAVGILGALGISTRKTEGTPRSDTATKKVEKPAVVQEWEKKNAGKKKVKIRDGSTGY